MLFHPCSEVSLVCSFRLFLQNLSAQIFYHYDSCKNLVSLLEKTKRRIENPYTPFRPLCTCYKSLSKPNEISSSICSKYSCCFSLLLFKIFRIRSVTGIWLRFSYMRYERGTANTSAILIKFSSDIVLLLCSIRLIESTESSAFSASSN